MEFFHSFLWLSNIPLYTHSTSYLSIRQWTFRLLPCLGYSKLCCYEYWDVYIFLNCSLCIYAQNWDLQDHMITSWEIGKQWKLWLTLFWGAPKSLQMVTAAMKLRDLLLGRNAMTNLDSLLKSRDITLPTKVHLVKAMVFPVVMYGCESWTVKKAEHWKLMLLNCGVGEDSWKSLGLQGDPTSPSYRSVLGVHWKDWCWSWNSSTLVTPCEELAHWKKPWYWEGLGAGGEGGDRGWDGWMASPTWAWVWVNSRSWWWTGRPGVLRFMGSQRVRHNWANELNWIQRSWSRRTLMHL